MPAISFKSLWHIFAESEIGKAFDGDVIVVVEIDELAEFQVAGERRRFRRDAFHQIAIGNDRIDVMINEREILLVKFCGEVRRAHRHADTVGKALAQRAGRNLDARRQAVFGMARSSSIPIGESS